jgi:putative two-component system response regulator
LSDSGPNNAARVLVVDDEVVIASLLQHVLEAEGFEVEVAHDGLEALAALRDRQPDLVLMDVDMPRMSGDEVCRRLKSNPATRLLPVIMITARGDLPRRLDAWEYGADEFLSKPFQAVEVTARCRSLLRTKRLVEERDSAEAVVFALARAVEAKSPFTHGHSERVTRYVLALADQVRVSEADRDILRKGALLHDIGKLSVPDAILNKPGSLTAEEYEIVKCHSASGAHIVEPLASVRDAIPLIRWHHERPDGKGYPDGLRGEAIPLPARILAVADACDAMTSDRPYRKGMSPARVEQVLRDGAGRQWDARLVGAFLECKHDVLSIAQRGIGESMYQAIDHALNCGNGAGAPSPQGQACRPSAQG